MGKCYSVQLFELVIIWQLSTYFFLLLNKFQGPFETIFLVIAPHEIETQHDDFVEKKYIILGRIFSSHTNHYISYQ